MLATPAEGLSGKFTKKTLSRRSSDLAGTYLEEVAEKDQPAEVKTVEDLLANIESEKLYAVLIEVDKLTLQAVLLQIQGFSISEIAKTLGMKEDTVYKRLQRLKEKIKKVLG